MSARVALALGGVLATSLAVPGVAGAHVRIGTLAVDVRVRVLSPSQHAPFAVTADSGSRSLRLEVEQGHRVVVLGYLGEPMLRIDGRGVEVNAASPTADASGLVAKSGKHTGWEQRDGAAVWRDPRLQGLPSGSERASWSIPLLVDGRRTQIAGELERVPRPTVWPWLLLALALAGAGSLFALSREQHRLREGCVVLGGVSTLAAMVAAAGFAFEPHATGSRVAAVYLLLFAVGGAGFAVFGPQEVRVAAAAWLGLLGLMAGLAFGQVFLHGFVLSVLPAAVTRAAATLAVGSGAAACLLGGLFYARLEPAPPALPPALPRR